MNKDTVKEILKSYFYGVNEESILEIYSISKEDLDKIIKEEIEYLNNLKVRDYE